MSFTPEHFTVWAEIPVADFDRAIGFYNTVFATEMKRDETGPNAVAFFPPANQVVSRAISIPASRRLMVPARRYTSPAPTNWKMRWHG